MTILARTLTCLCVSPALLAVACGGSDDPPPAGASGASGVGGSATGGNPGGGAGGAGAGGTGAGGVSAGGSGGSGAGSGAGGAGIGGSAGASGAGAAPGSGATAGTGGSSTGGTSGGAPPGPDTQEPYPIDMGDAGPQTPGSYKGLPLRLTDNGSPTVTAVNGVIGVVCIGMSNSNQECSDFISKLSGGQLVGKSAAVKVVNCAVGGNAIEKWNDAANDQNLWDACVQTKLGAAGVTANQVRVVYHKAAKQFTIVNPAYPASGSDYFAFYSDLTAFSQRVKQKFPAVQAVYTTSRSYGGFSNNPSRGEPLSYEEGHALNTWLEDNPSVSGVWHGWGPYIWAPDCASGDVNKSDVCYLKSDYQADGVHPAKGARDKISSMIHARFMLEPWYKN